MPICSVSSFLKPLRAGGASQKESWPPLGACSCHSDITEPKPEPKHLLTTSKNGSYTELKVTGGSSQPVQGKKVRIKGFTKRSQKTLRRVFNQIDEEALRRFVIVFVTLTYPVVFPDPRKAKRQLKAIIRRFRKVFGDRYGVWKMEPQERGAPHFHLVLFCQDKSEAEMMQEWWSKTWCDRVVKSGDPLHLAFHQGLLGNKNKPCCEIVESWERVKKYITKYLGKPCTSPRGWPWPGRFWGQICRDLRPCTIAVQEITASEAAKLRRIVRRHLEHVPTNRMRVERQRDSEGNRRIERYKVKDKAHRELLLSVKRYPDGGQLARVYHYRSRFHFSGGVTSYLPAAVMARVLRYLGIVPAS